METLTDEQLAYIERHGATKNPKTIAKELKLELRRVQKALRDLKDRPKVPTVATLVASAPAPAPTPAAAPAPVPARRATRLEHLVACVVIAVAGLIAYANNYSAGWHFDDFPAIVNNTVLRNATFSSIYKFNLYRQALNWTFALSYKLHETRPAGWHLENNLIHVVNGLLVYALVVLTLRAPSVASKVKWPHLVAGLAGLLFVVHPLQTQAVTYVTQRAESLCATFFLGAMLLYVVARLRRVEGRALATPLENAVLPATGAVAALVLLAAAFAGAGLKPFVVLSLLAVGLAVAAQVWLVQKRKADPVEAGLFAGSLLLTFVALQTKEIAGAIPGALALWELLFVCAPAKSGRTLLDRVRERAALAPWAALIAFLPILAVRVGLDATLLMREGIDKNEAVRRAVSGSEYFLTELNVLATYVRLYLFPAGQHLDWDYPKVTSLFQGPTVLSLGALVATVAVAALARRRAPLVTFGVLFALGVLVPTSTIFVLPDFIFEHRVYLPLVGATIITAVLLERAVRAVVRDAQKAERAYLGTGAVLAIALAGLTLDRNTVWANEETLWTDSHLKSPEKPRALTNLGLYCQNLEPQILRVRTPEGIVEVGGRVYDGSAFNQPGVWIVAPTLVLANPRLPTRLTVPKSEVVEGPFEAGGLDKAKKHYEAALALDPDYYKARNNLAMCDIAAGALAIVELNDVALTLRQVNENRSAYPEPMIKNLEEKSKALEKDALEWFTAAEKNLIRCIEQKPDDFVSLNNLANLYHAYLDRGDEAIETMKRSIAVNDRQPVSFAVLGDMHFTRAQERADAGNAQGAKDDYSDAIRCYTQFLERGGVGDANERHVRTRLQMSEQGLRQGGVRMIPKTDGMAGAALGPGLQNVQRQQRWKPPRGK